MSTLIERQIQGAVDRVDKTLVALPSLTITSIFSALFPVALGCISKWIEKPSPSEMQKLVASEYEKNPEKLIRATARRIKRTSDEKVTRREALELGRAGVLQMVEGDSDEVAEACMVTSPVYDEYDGI